MGINLADLRTRRWLVGGILVLVLAIAGAVDAYLVRRRSVPAPIEVSASLSVSASPSPSSSKASSVSPSPSSADLPAAAQQAADKFYAAYAAKQAETLSSLFTPDTSPELISLRSRLFKGVDPQGNPGGPTVFSTNSANQSAVSHTVTSAQKLPNGDWQLKVTEQRVNGQGNAAGSVQTVMTLAPVSGSDSWLIDSYSYPSTPSKYGAFLIQ